MKTIQTCIRCKTDSFEGVIFSAKQSEMIKTYPKTLIGIKFEPVVCDFCRKGIGNGISDNILQTYKKTIQNELKS